MQLFYSFRSADPFATPHAPRVFAYPWDAADYAASIGEYETQMRPQDVISHLLATGGRYYELSVKASPRRRAEPRPDVWGRTWTREEEVPAPSKEISGLPLPLASAAAFPRYIRALNQAAAQALAAPYGCQVEELDAYQCAEAHAFLGQPRPSPTTVPTSRPPRVCA